MTADSPQFSILLPTHNRADVLGFSIASILAQTFRDFELLIVADGCTDHTAQVVAGFEDPRIRFFDLPKAPYFGYANRNVALRQARGACIAYAAHDDLLLPDHLELMGALMRRTAAALAYSRPLWVSTDGFVAPFGVNLEIDEELAEFLDGRNTIPSLCFVHTRMALSHAGYWPENVAEGADNVLWRRMVVMSDGKIAYLRQPTSLHFSADWRKSRHAGFGDVAMLIQIAETAQWWPAVLRCRPIVEPEQAAFWHALQAGGPEWVARLRAAVEVVMDKIAWEAIGKRQPLLQKTLESAQSELLDARAEAEASARLARDMREEFASKLTEIESAGDLRRELLGEFEAAKAAVAGAAQRAEIVQSEILSALAKLEGAGVQAKMVHGEMEVVRLRIEEANEQAKATADGVVAALQSLQQALVAQENRRNLSMPDPTAVLFARLASLRRASTEAMRRLRGHFRRTRSRRQRAQSVGKEN